MPALRNRPDLRPHDRLGVLVGALAKTLASMWLMVGRGPPYARFGGRCGGLRRNTPQGVLNP